MAKILVTGATGTIGKALIQTLRQKNADFVAAVRNPGQAAAKLQGVPLVDFDFADSSTFESATAGVDRVFLLGPPLVTTLDELLTPFIDFLKKKKIDRIVYISALGAEMFAGLPFHTILTEKLERDGFDYTILKPSFFAQNFKNYEDDNITRHGIIYSPAGMGKAAFVDAHDVAAVAAIVLTTEGHSGKTYKLTGPEAFSYQDVAALLSEVTGKTILYPNPSPAEYTATLQAAGAPEFIAPYMISVYAVIAGGNADVLYPDIENLTGKKPAALKTVLARDFNKIG